MKIFQCFSIQRPKLYSLIALNVPCVPPYSLWRLDPGYPGLPANLFISMVRERSMAFGGSRPPLTSKEERQPRPSPPHCVVIYHSPVTQLKRRFMKNEIQTTITVSSTASMGLAAGSASLVAVSAVLNITRPECRSPSSSFWLPFRPLGATMPCRTVERTSTAPAPAPYPTQTFNLAAILSFIQ